MYAYTYVCMHTRMYVCIHSDASSSFFPPPVGAAPTAAGPGDEVSDEVSAASGAWPERFAKVAAVGERERERERECVCVCVLVARAGLCSADSMVQHLV